MLRMENLTLKFTLTLTLKFPPVSCLLKWDLNRYLLNDSTRRVPRVELFNVNVREGSCSLQLAEEVEAPLGLLGQ